MDVVPEVVREVAVKVQAAQRALAVAKAAEAARAAALALAVAESTNSKNRIRIKRRSGFPGAVLFLMQKILVTRQRKTLQAGDERPV